MTIECCIESLEEAKLAKDIGANRVELCAALDLGGLTPSLGLIRKTVHLNGPEVHTMIRNRGGGFVYTSEEIKLMAEEIKIAADAGAHGVVFGLLDEQGNMDLEGSKFLLEVAKTQHLEATFHRAFDFCIDPKETLNQLITLGFDRILTSGQAPTAMEGIELIRSLVGKANGKIQIMAGSGVSPENAEKLINAGADALHFSIRRKEEKMLPGMGDHYVPNQEKATTLAAILKKNRV